MASIQDTLATLITKAAGHAGPFRFGRREAALASVIAAGPAIHGSVLVLTSKTVTSNAITLSIPANTLVAGDAVRIRGGAATDGGSTAVTINLTAAGATLVSSGSDTNTAAHQWSGEATLYYDGTNLVTAGASISDGTTTVSAVGASNAQSATAACAITVAASVAHATPSALVVVVLRP